VWASDTLKPAGALPRRLVIGDDSVLRMLDSANTLIWRRPRV
jgi:hypothetical protein